jgi:hypothetical protein
MWITAVVHHKTSKPQIEHKISGSPSKAEVGNGGENRGSSPLGSASQIKDLRSTAAAVSNGCPITGGPATGQKDRSQILHCSES